MNTPLCRLCFLHRPQAGPLASEFCSVPAAGRQKVRSDSDATREETRIDLPPSSSSSSLEIQVHCSRLTLPLH